MSLRVMRGTATAAASECVRAWMRSSLISGSVRTSAEAGRSADFSQSACKRMRQQRASRSCSRENFVVFLVVPAHIGMWSKNPNPVTGHLRFKVQASLSIIQSFSINQSINLQSFNQDSFIVKPTIYIQGIEISLPSGLRCKDNMQVRKSQKSY